MEDALLCTVMDCNALCNKIHYAQCTLLISWLSALFISWLSANSCSCAVREDLFDLCDFLQYSVCCTFHVAHMLQNAHCRLHVKCCARYTMFISWLSDNSCILSAKQLPTHSATQIQLGQQKAKINKRANTNTRKQEA